MRKQSTSINKLSKYKTSTIPKFDPDLSQINIHQFSQHFGHLKRSDSSTNLTKKSSNQLFMIQQKYQKLQHNFKKILEQTKITTKIFKKQKDQIQKFKEQSLKDKKQIERLRMMLGFIKKEDFGIQVQVTDEEEINLDKAEIQTSTGSKTSIQIEKQLRSTMGKMKRKSSKPRFQNSLNKNLKEKLTSYKSEKTIYFSNIESQKSIRSKYKFVPTLDLN